MVLNRPALIGLVIALATGCGESLFDAHGKLDGGGDQMVPSTCPDVCLADASADFAAMPQGAGHWQYLEDHRNRTWSAMTASAGALVGAEAANQITSCAASPDAAACKALPGALLISTAGSASTADPALAYTSTTAQVLQLSVLVRVPAGQPDQVVRIYRNSREDVLFTGNAIASSTFSHAITVDALPADRLFVALAPTDAGATEVGVHLFVNATTDTFPKACQLAVPFTAATGNTVANLCGAPVTHLDDTVGAKPPVLAAGPFPELGMAAHITPMTYFETSGVLDKSADVTVQLWLRHDTFVTPYAGFAFSDLDLDMPGGLSIDLYPDPNDGTTQLEAFTSTMVTPQIVLKGDHAPFPAGWHFVRVVHHGGTVEVCIDGARATSFPAPAGSLSSTYHPYLGRNVVWTPSGSYFDGGIDDVRVFTGALPCN